MMLAIMLLLVLAFLCTEVGREMLHEAYLTIRYNHHVRNQQQTVIDMAEQFCKQSSTDKD